MNNLFNCAAPERCHDRNGLAILFSVLIAAVHLIL